MRVAITGASGLIGNNLALRLLSEGHQVVAADRHRSNSLDDLDVDFVEVDVLDSDSLRKAFDGVEVVFHLAALISIVGDPDGMVRRVNVEGPRNAARAALDVGVRRMVHMSSVHAFDLHTCGPSLDESGPRTTGAHAPAYDRTKFDGEQEVRKLIDEGLDAVIVNQCQLSDTGRSEVLQGGRSDPAQPDQNDMRIGERYLTCTAHFGKYDMPGKTLDPVRRNGHAA